MTSAAIDSAWNLFTDIALKSGLLCALAVVGLFLLRRSSAASRHLVLRLLLGALLALPLLSLTLPRWQIPVNWQTQTAREPAEVTGRMNSRLQTREVRLRGLNSSGRSFTGRSFSGRPMASISTPPLQDAPAVVREPDLRPSSAAREARLGSRVRFWETETLKRGVLAIWLLGGLAILGRALLGMTGLRRLRRCSLPVTRESARRLAADVQNAMGIRRRVTLLEMPEKDALRVPIVFGLFRPTILLPSGLAGWPPERLRLILLHEMSHLRRYDGLAQALGQMACALFWFNPMVWRAAHRMREECERACDDSVLLTGIAPSAYAATLLEVIRLMKNSRSFPQSALSMARPPIEKRLRAILTPRAARLRTLQRPVAAFIWLGTAACVLPLAALHVSATPQPKEALHRHTAALPDFSVNEDSSVNAALLPSFQARDRYVTRLTGQGRDDELDALRERIMVLERALKQSQQENQELRRQLERLRTQMDRGAELGREAALQNKRLLEEQILLEKETLLRARRDSRDLLRDERRREEDLLRSRRAELEAELLRQGKKEEAGLLKQRRKEEAALLKERAKEEKAQKLKEEVVLLKEREKADKARLKEKQKDKPAPTERKPEASREVQQRALESALDAIREKLAALHAQLQQKEERYRAGLTTANGVQETKAQLESVTLKARVIEQQLNDLKAGRKISVAEQERRKSDFQLEELAVRMNLAQEKLLLARQKYEAGLIPQSEVLEMEQQMAALKVQMAEIQAGRSR